MEFHVQVASQTGPGTCFSVVSLFLSVYAYGGVSGTVAYAPVPNGTTTFNSNSFTFTLLSNVGLGNVFTPFVGWSPGWGQLVPGLHP